MNKNLVLSLLFILLFSCERERNVDLQKNLKNETSTQNIEVLFADPIVIDSTEIVMYPLIFESIESGGYSSGRYKNVTYWNLVFYNTKTKQQSLLAGNQKLVIHDIYLEDKYNNLEKNKKGNILYRVISKDYDGNGAFDDEDPKYLYVSDKEGKEFRQISPPNYHILNWKSVEGTTQLLIQAQKDENGDKKFDEKEKIIPLIVDIQSSAIANPTFEENYIDSLKNTFVKIWKPKK